MADFGDVRTWQAGPLHAAADDVNACCERFRGLSDELQASAVPSGWQGRGAAAASRKCRRIADAWEDRAAIASALQRSLFDTARAVEGLNQAVEVAEELARRNHFVIQNNGAVSSTLPGGLILADDEVDARKTVEAELVDRIEQIIRRGKDIDNDLCALLDGISSGDVDAEEATSIASAVDVGAGQGAMSITSPPQGGSPTDNAAWWATLSQSERQTLLSEHPELLGNRNGLPAHIRDQANQARIPVERTRLQEELRHADSEDRRDEIKAKLGSLDRIESILQKPDRHLLTLDMSHQRAEAAIANGDVDTADHVAVFTPGFTSTVNDSMVGYDDNMRDVKLRSERILEKVDPGATVATVTWLGYRPRRWMRVCSRRMIRFCFPKLPPTVPRGLTRFSMVSMLLVLTIRT